MGDSITTKSVGKGFAVIEKDFILDEQPMSRLIFRAQMHDGGIRGQVLRQRRAGSDDAWEIGKTVPIRTLQPGEAMSLEIRTSAMNELIAAIDQLSALAKQQGVNYGRHKYVTGEEGSVILTTANKAAYINKLLESGYSEDFWAELVENDPDLATKLSLSKISADRIRSLGEFKAAMLDETKDESWWQSYFEKNTWIFGYGLNYQILKSVQSQPTYGGKSVDGTGSQKGDFLHKTAAEVSFTVLVEIKKPTTQLLESEYRNGAWSPARELAGGVAQLQTNCHMWEKEGSVTEVNRDRLEKTESAFTVRPKGILVVGNCKELSIRDKIKSFELYRRNLKNPEIITFDELLARASFIVNNTNSSDRID